MAVLACAIVAATSGCGESPASPAHPGEVRAAIAATESAFLAGDWQLACAGLTPDARLAVVDFAPGPAAHCPEAMRSIHGLLAARLSDAQLARLPSIEPAKVAIDGDRATATLGAPPPDLAILPTEGAAIALERDEGRWLLAGLDF